MSFPDPLTERRYPTLRDGGRRPQVRASGPGPGSGVEHDPEHASMLYARIVIVATIVMGQLWGLTVALNEWLSHRLAHVWWILGFEALSFLVALAAWLAESRDR